ncbi:hypothetical protein DFH09DRAFT_1311176 [Mycena vulgaris]|nr:hypothetical protein DFH09DRAFT_1311176 [Mycena vulgaris]
MPDLPLHHVVSLQDTTEIALTHPHSKSTIVIKRTQLPILPAFAMTAHKVQGKTYERCVVNFTGCRGTESPYVMVSRAKSLQGLVILTPFSKDKICSRQSEDVRTEFHRLQYLGLNTVVLYGNHAEALSAKSELKKTFATPAPGGLNDDAMTGTGEDVGNHVDRLQRLNAVLTAPARCTRLPVNSPLAATAQVPAATVSGALVQSRLTTKKRKLDDASPMSASKSTSKRPRQ